MLQQTVRPAIHTAEGSAAGQRAGTTQGKAIEQNSKERKRYDGAAASDLSHQLTSPEAPEHTIAGLLLQCQNVIMSLKINVHKRALLRMT